MPDGVVDGDFRSVDVDVGSIAVVASGEELRVGIQLPLDDLLRLVVEEEGSGQVVVGCISIKFQREGVSVLGQTGDGGVSLQFVSWRADVDDRILVVIVVVGKVGQCGMKVELLVGIVEIAVEYQGFVECQRDVEELLKPSAVFDVCFDSYFVVGGLYALVESW